MILFVYKLCSPTNKHSKPEAFENTNQIAITILSWKKNKKHTNFSSNHAAIEESGHNK